MAGVTYRIEDYSKEFLQKHRFKYNNYLSDVGDEIYTYKFPLIIYNKTTTIECEIAVSVTTGIVNVNVQNTGTKELYSSYYDREFGNCELLKSINMKIEKKLNELGIEKI